MTIFKIHINLNTLIYLVEKTILKCYTNPERNKKYYEQNSNIVKEKAKNYMEKIKETNPGKLKEWRHQAYLNRKVKLNAKKDNK